MCILNSEFGGECKSKEKCTSSRPGATDNEVNFLPMKSVIFRELPKGQRKHAHFLAVSATTEKSASYSLALIDLGLETGEQKIHEIKAD